MAKNQPSNHNVPESISFLVLLNELQRRRQPTSHKNAESDLLWEELIQREHRLEQSILRQLEHSLVRNQSWWMRIYNTLVYASSRLLSGFKPSAPIEVKPENSKKHKVGELD